MLSLSTMIEGFRKGSTRRASVRALKGLSAAQLRDIGVPPDQIGEVVDAMVDSSWRLSDTAPRRSAAPVMLVSPQAPEACCG